MGKGMLLQSDKGSVLDFSMILAESASFPPSYPGCIQIMCPLKCGMKALPAYKVITYISEPPSRSRA